VPTVILPEGGAHGIMAIMGRPPLIAVAVGRESVGGRVFAAAPDDYVTSVIAAGGIPFLVPPLPAAAAGWVLSPAAGLLLTGGGDVAPGRYGEEADPATGQVDEERDESELALVRQAGAMGIPILAICRGAQLLNIALGGTLSQHISDDGPVRHRRPERRYEAVHRVDVEAATVLASAVAARHLMVNSIHHQAVKRVAPGLRASAFAEDGVIEALEGLGGRVLAVQWHPECLPVETASKGLFSWLVERACAIHRSVDGGGAREGVLTEGNQV
jgi:putative glutamine amidotransferase